jgi:hypothetical protein
MVGNDFKKTIEFHKHFSVKEISSFPISVININDLNEEVIKKYQHFDFIPVKKDGNIIGVFERNLMQADDIIRHFEDHFRSLGEEMLIEAEASLNELIHKFNSDSPYLLVLRGARIEGIVTRSDLLKLPVRVFAFSLIAELELLMKERIISIYSSKKDEDWLIHLSEGRKIGLHKRYLKYQSNKLDPNKIDLTTLEDKATILKKSTKLTNKFSKTVASIIQLRNQLVHARDYASTNEELDVFLERLDKTYWLIRELHGYEIEEKNGEVWGEGE